MESTKNNYKANEDVVCTKCGAHMKARDMVRHTAKSGKMYIYCFDCEDSILVYEKTNNL